MTWMKGLPLLLVLGACGEQTPPGHYYEIDLLGIEDECTEGLSNFSETVEYRVQVDGSTAYIYEDGSLLAVGSINGCDLTYRSSIFSEARDGQVIRYSISGEAQVSRANGCDDAGNGWVGQETLEIFESSDPDIVRGCTYVYEVDGQYLGEEK